MAAQFIEEPAEKLSVREGAIWVEGELHLAASVAEIMGWIAPHVILGRGRHGPNPKDKSIRTFGVQCVEVEVDTETGELTVVHVVSSNDCGRIVNPTIVDSQVIGGVTQGLGFALTEERIADAQRGIVLNANLEEYKVPTVADIPPIEHAQVDLPDPAANSTGAKGIGEPPIVPTGPAIANAIFDAIGIRLSDAPLTRDRLLAALAAQNGSEPR